MRPLHDAVVLKCMRRGCLAFNPRLLQERLEFAFELSSTVGSDGANLDACGGDVFCETLARLFRSIVFMLDGANELEAGEVLHAQHRVLVAAERSHRKGTCDVDEESLRALISAAFGRFWHSVTSHPDSEHCTRGLRVPVSGTLDMRAIPRVISSLETPWSL